MKTIRNDVRRPAAELVDGFRTVLGNYSRSCLVTDLVDPMPVLAQAQPGDVVIVAYLDFPSGTYPQQGRSAGKLLPHGNWQSRQPVPPRRPPIPDHSRGEQKS
jgi:hypothetical protein